MALIDARPDHHIPGPKETVYDEQMHPLILKLKALAEQHDISIIMNIVMNEDVDTVKCSECNEEHTLHARAHMLAFGKSGPASEHRALLQLAKMLGLLPPSA